MIHDLLTKFKKPSVYAEGFLFLILLLFFSCATPPAPTVQTESEAQTSLVPERISWLKIKNTDWAEYFFYENKRRVLVRQGEYIKYKPHKLLIICRPSPAASKKGDVSYGNIHCKRQEHRDHSFAARVCGKTRRQSHQVF